MQLPVVLRDPFVSQISKVRRSSIANGLRFTRAVVGLRVREGQPIGFLAPTNGVRLYAVVSGASQRALIDDGQRTRIVTVGDAVAGSRITGIKNHRVFLADGRSLSIGEKLR